ncbi:MAG: PLP-dependent aminotransferase family protein, partial [Anaerolineales bacterium]
TYVSPSLTLPDKPSVGASMPAEWPVWQYELLPRRDISDQPVFESGIYLAERKDLISLAGGLPDSRLFPVEDFRKVFRSILRRDGIRAFEYGDGAGYLPLRHTIAQILSSQGIPARPENLLITSGSQQGIALVTQVLTRPGDVVIVEDPTYASALDFFRACGLKVIGIPVDSRGMAVEQLEEIMRAYHPRMIYTIPNFQNPTGVCMSGQRRRLLVVLSARYNIPILEDDFVGDLRYDGRAQPALKALDADGNVLLIGTFSKMLMPGLRVGYVLAQGPVFQQLMFFKKISDLATSTLTQRALEAYITVGRYQAHLRRACHAYRRRRDALAEALRTYLPEVRFELPQGGIFLWAQLPGGIFSEDLYPLAWQEGVTFAVGSAFSMNKEKSPFMRLTFSQATPAEIDLGIRRLAKAVARLQG